ncbi:hypothetical protein ACWELO_02470 [Streptomyces sp. NPDC004596]
MTAFQGGPESTSGRPGGGPEAVHQQVQQAIGLGFQVCPVIQVVCRDQAPFFAEGATAGAPQSVQVAERWQLWHNLGEAAERCVVDLPWNPGVVEGCVNRIKMLKRQMFGRAGFPLLRKWVLLYW